MLPFQSQLCEPLKASTLLTKHPAPEARKHLPKCPEKRDLLDSAAGTGEKVPGGEAKPRRGFLLRRGL